MAQAERAEIDHPTAAPDAGLGAHPQLQRPWREWYQLERWRRRRRLQLRKHPLCKICHDHNRTTAATIADHVTPHRGDWNAFMLGDLQSLCFACHQQKSIEQRKHVPFDRERALGFALAVDDSGWPIDPAHPANAGPLAKPANNKSQRQHRQRGQRRHLTDDEADCLVA